MLFCFKRESQYIWLQLRTPRSDPICSMEPRVNITNLLDKNICSIKMVYITYFLGVKNEVQTLVANNVVKDSTHLFKTLRKVRTFKFHIDIRLSIGSCT